MKVLVIGDSCTDVFRYGTCDRLSPEAPVPVFLPTRTTENGGMAINVMENLMALGIDCDIITNVGKPVKTRYVDEVSNQILLRVDVNDDIMRVMSSTMFEIKYENYDAVVISDYNKGYLEVDDIIDITNHHPLVFMDTKKKIGDWAKGVEFMKLNEKEFNENWNKGFEFQGDLVTTRGKDGALLNFHEVFPIEDEQEVRDLSGAGDTFLATLVADYIKNGDIRNAIKYANRCASWVVSQKGVVTVNLEMI